jgi:phosphoribosylglycinamide formyltransferase-1
MSAGGSAFTEAARIANQLPIEFLSLTDRPCLAEIRCRELSIPVRRIVESNNNLFSLAAQQYFAENEVELCLLYFSRIITRELFEVIPCCNVHPSLLPAFPGMSAVKRAWSEGARFIGATVHHVDQGVDTGPIIAQASTPIPTTATLEWCERISFLQKTLVTLVTFELLITDSPLMSGGSCALLSHSPKANPTLTDPSLVEGFKALQASLEMEVFP